jgi:Protein of unknown function (DUF2934)
MRYILTCMNRSPAFNPLRFVETIVPAKPREALIAERAYFRAERRGFEPGHEGEDWLAAEAEVDLLLSGGGENI